MARTTTRTNTYTREVCLKNQFDIAFQRLTDCSENKRKLYLQTIEDKKIEYISFWAYDYNNGEREKWIELTLFVDWGKHDNYILSGNDKIKLKSSWNGILPEIGATINIVQETIDEYQLETSFSVGFSKSVIGNEYEYLMNKLGLVHGKSIRWKGNRKESKLVYKGNPNELGELNATIHASSELI